MKNEDQLVALIKENINLEAEALLRIIEQVDGPYAEAVEAIMSCGGSVILTGLGKTGHIAKKIAATFASLGTKAFFVHSCEALHGDMGMIGAQDVVIMLSNSGSSTEILAMLKPLRLIGATLISITKGKDTPLAKETDIALSADAGDEIDHLGGLAPTSSSTSYLAIGDALATVVSQLKGFTRSDFALSHPGGALGRQLLQDS